ncbi:type II secretion system F family protein [Acetobacterium paludosum]|uniref:Type II secretion system F family protein n=1 Tax=Acetobacterium paludosum TaxID=52693 RepID=A0A923HZN1_9FIRM|nr:type II secretion system F family protein [Acetobacterium paludosum]MBC3888941.1 type II secretion system F family protein [Acetobacterium paludosum]
MMLLTISISLLVFILTIIVFYGKGKTIDTKSRRLDSIKKRNQHDLDDDFEKPFFQRVILPVFTAVIKRVSVLFPKSKGNKTEKLETSLRLAGLHLAVNEYNASRLVFSGAFILAAFILTAFTRLSLAMETLIILLSILFSVISPILLLKTKIRKRQGAIANEMPDVMDLLCVSMEAGLGFDSAMVKIGERLSGVLVTELNIVHSEINFGKPRREALKSLADRNSVEELKTFVGSIIQAEQLGIPINQVLKSQAEELRIKRRQRAEEKAMKAPVKMMIPLVVFVLPVLFIVLLGPTILQVVKQFGGI